MPDYVDKEIITVLTFYPATITVAEPLVVLANGEKHIFHFLYNHGFPFASGFSVTWYSDSARTIEITNGVPYDPVFSPATPTGSQFASTTNRLEREVLLYQRAKGISDGDLLGVDGSLIITAPNVAPKTEDTDEFAEFYGHITIHQADFNRQTGLVV